MIFDKRADGWSTHISLPYCTKQLERPRGPPVAQDRVFGAILFERASRRYAA